jgi:Trehalose and maltose hydrolases (possible phosphorylases)
MGEYRFQCLQAARNDTYSHGFLPWESVDSEVEETPGWALAGPFENHITASVALAVWQYYCVTQDISWLRKRVGRLSSRLRTSGIVVQNSFTEAVESA